MPDLSKIPVPKYDPLNPYHWEYDNVPIKNLELRDELINGELENHKKILLDTSGNQGTLSNRLNQSLNQNGSLKTSSVDEANHNIAKHSDGSKTVEISELDYYNNTLNYQNITNPVKFVRMLEAERAKLALISSEANNIIFEVETPSNTLVIEEGRIYLRSSNNITWDITYSENTSDAITIKPILITPIEFAHRHYYDIDPITNDYINYKVTSVNTPYVEGSLRVYINGIKLTSSAETYVPGNLMSDEWILNGFIPNHESGTFKLNQAITSEDIIRIDFDISLS